MGQSAAEGPLASAEREWRQHEMAPGEGRRRPAQRGDEAREGRLRSKDDAAGRPSSIGTVSAFRETREAPRIDVPYITSLGTP